MFRNNYNLIKKTFNNYYTNNDIFKKLKPLYSHCIKKNNYSPFIKEMASEIEIWKAIFFSSLNTEINKMASDNFYKDYVNYIKNIIEDNDFKNFWSIYNKMKHEPNFHLKSINPDILKSDDIIISVSKLWKLFAKIVLLENKPMPEEKYKDLYILNNNILVPKKVLLKKVIIMIPSKCTDIHNIYKIKCINNFFKPECDCYDYNFKEYIHNKKYNWNDILKIRNLDYNDIEYKISLMIHIKAGSDHWSKLDIKSKINYLLGETIYENIKLNKRGATCGTCGTCCNSKRKLTEDDLKIVTNKLTNTDYNLSLLFNK
jgi:hypothetical protein